MSTGLDNLQRLYAATSKHSNYQVLANRLAVLLHDRPVTVKSRFEAERFAYIRSKIDLVNKTVVDIGGNTGYFTFETLDAGAKHVTYYEGNREHSDFVVAAAQMLDLSGRVSVHNQYLDFLNAVPSGRADIIFLLNVLHHTGDDYGNQDMGMESAKAEMLTSLNSLARMSDWMVFQLGFCWKGDRTQLLFPDGTKEEMIRFIENGITGYWEIEHVGIAEKNDVNIIYREPAASNLVRNDQMGEFLNRPIFILRSIS